MNAALFTARAGGEWLALILAALVLAGCVTQKIDWSARVGNYTYDQAVMELGPPDKSAKLTDGTVVADWLVHHAQIIVAPEPYFAPPGCYFGPLTPMRTETCVPAQYLRLTFGADGKLKTWREHAG
ncbi:MAG: hypothetical protein ABSF10_03150 [Verrucomicrobiota bacterium]|jgi:hypothetical protein